MTSAREVITATIFEKENYTKKLKRNFDSWREAVLVLNSILLWRNKYYPCAIVCAVTFLFIELLYHNPSFLTTISVIGLIVTLLDYAGPTVCNTIWNHETWTASKERELEEICEVLAGIIVSMKNNVKGLRDMKSSRPNLFYTVAITFLFISACIGNIINNLLITYIIVLAISLLPGSLHHGFVQKTYRTVALNLASLLHGISSNSKTKLH